MPSYSKDIKNKTVIMTKIVYLLSVHGFILLKFLFSKVGLLLLLFWQSCFLKSVSLTQRASFLSLVPFFVKLVTLSSDARWALTVWWQATTAMSIAGKHKVLCLNELPCSLSSPPPVIRVISLISLFIIRLMSVCACLFCLPLCLCSYSSTSLALICFVKRLRKVLQLWQIILTCLKLKS